MGRYFSDIIELRLPPKEEYQSLVLALIGAIAGDSSFNYVQIIQLKVAVSEAFQLAIKRVERTDNELSPLQITMRLKPRPNRLEVLIPWLGNSGGVTNK